MNLNDELIKLKDKYREKRKEFIKEEDWTKALIIEKELDKLNDQLAKLVKEIEKERKK